jgi:hypothetical protein
VIWELNNSCDFFGIGGRRTQTNSQLFAPSLARLAEFWYIHSLFNPQEVWTKVEIFRTRPFWHPPPVLRVWEDFVRGRCFAPSSRKSAGIYSFRIWYIVAICGCNTSQINTYNFCCNHHYLCKIIVLHFLCSSSSILLLIGIKLTSSTLLVFPLHAHIQWAMSPTTNCPFGKDEIATIFIELSIPKPAPMIIGIPAS